MLLTESSVQTKQTEYLNRKSYNFLKNGPGIEITTTGEKYL
jgi:hypothetical protein